MATTPSAPRRSLQHQPLERPPSLVQRVTEHVRRCIVDAEWKLGEYISEERIASALGVSRTPVREALNALQMQGLVSIQPQRGTFVFLPSASDVAELCEFRLIMEGRAMALCLARQKEATLQAMRAANTAMVDAASRRDTLAYSQADSALHNALFAHCGNRYVAEAYGLMSSRFDALRNHLSAISARSNPSPVEEHAEIIDAFGAGDLARAENLLSVHIFAMRERFAAAKAAGVMP